MAQVISHFERNRIFYQNIPVFYVSSPSRWPRSPAAPLPPPQPAWNQVAHRLRLPADRLRRRALPGALLGLGLAKLGKLAKFCRFLAGSFSAVSKRNFARKYAFDSIFQDLQDLHPFAPLQSQFFRKKSVWKNSNFREISAKKLQMSQNLQNYVKFQKFQLKNLVDFEKCCKTHIFLQKSEPIQPKTSNILPKICRSAVVSPSSRLQ